jgi:hypothetical protein
VNKYSKIILFGLLLWLIPFAVSVMIYPLRIYQRVLFESIMPVVITIWTVFFCLIYFLGEGRGSLRDGILLGFGWLMISIVLDLIFFMQGPMKMPFMDYLADIGITYLIIPAITIGFGYFIEKNVGI